MDSRDEDFSICTVPPTTVNLLGEAKSPIASGAALPAGRAIFWTSGAVRTKLNKEGKTIYERYGDTHTQGGGYLKNIEQILAAQGLTMKDVVYLRICVTPDAAKDGKPDFAGWFKTQGECFNNEKNPAKAARSTVVALTGLVSPDWLIEIEDVDSFNLLDNIHLKNKTLVEPTQF